MQGAINWPKNYPSTLQAGRVAVVLTTLYYLLLRNKASLWPIGPWIICDHHLMVICCGVFRPEKVHIIFLNFYESLFFLPELENWVNHLPELLKPFILPPWLVISSFQRRFVFFFFIYFGWIFKKIIINHRKVIKWKNSILLDCTWVDLSSVYIIWYALVQVFLL